MMNLSKTEMYLIDTLITDYLNGTPIMPGHFTDEGILKLQAIKDRIFYEIFRIKIDTKDKKQKRLELLAKIARSE